MRWPIEQVVQQLLRAGHEQVHLVDHQHSDAPVAAPALLESPIQDIVRNLRRQALAHELLRNRRVRVLGCLQTETVEFHVIEPGQRSVPGFLAKRSNHFAHRRRLARAWNTRDVQTPAQTLRTSVDGLLHKVNNFLAFDVAARKRAGGVRQRQCLPRAAQRCGRDRFVDSRRCDSSETHDAAVFTRRRGCLPARRGDVPADDSSSSSTPEGYADGCAPFPLASGALLGRRLLGPLRPAPVVDVAVAVLSVEVFILVIFVNQRESPVEEVPPTGQVVVG